MPELPEVEWVVRGLNRALAGATIQSATVHRPRSLRPTLPETLVDALTGARVQTVQRRGKYLLFHLTPAKDPAPLRICAHLGMTGRMHVVPADQPLPRHAVVSMDLGSRRFVFEDARGFGRFTLDVTPMSHLGPEPLSEAFSPASLLASATGSRQPIKTFLLDQSRVAGVGNIYASESLFRARIHPGRPAGSLSADESVRLHHAVRAVLSEAIAAAEAGDAGTRFYYGDDGSQAAGEDSRFQVYDRAGQACPSCGSVIQRRVQAGRSTFFCAACQPLRRSKKPRS
jgi:formamidopyrimidine-DNA glycosylase